MSEHFDSAETLNIPMARKVLEHLIAHPEEHNQSEFGQQRPGCGTVMCIAGTAAWLDPDTEIFWTARGVMRIGDDDTLDTVEDRGAKLLGLTSARDVDDLFYEMDNGTALEKLADWIRWAEAVQS